MLYFFYGNEHLLDLESQKRKEKLIQEGYRIESFDLSSKEEEGEQFLQELSMNSMFAEKKAFFLKHLENVKSSTLQHLLKSMALFDITEKEIIMTLSGKEIGKSIEKELAKLQHQVFAFTTEQQEKQLQEYLEKKLAIAPYEAEKLLEMLGKDFYKLEQESNKILQFLDGEAFHFDTVFPILSIEKDYNIFLLIDQFLENEKTEALLDYLQQNPNDSGLFLYQLGDSLCLLAKLSSFLEKNRFDAGVSYTAFKNQFSEIQDYCRNKSGKTLHPYPVYLKLKIAKKQPVEFWLQKIEEVLTCEYRFKSGFMDMSTSISEFILGFYSSSSNIRQGKQKGYPQSLPKI